MMSEGSFETFITAGLLLLVAAILAVGWLLWSMRDAREDAEEAALEGVTHELRLNLQRMLGELMRLSGGANYSTGALMDIRHPQLDAVNGALVHCDRRALAVMGETYQELAARKLHLRAALEAGQAGEEELDDAAQAAIDGVATLYMWHAHDGCRPIDAKSTRSWDVRDWMKTNGFGQFVLPGLHLRDAVVERLRQFGMTLTPRPLSMTAYEYWSMRYDRNMDPNGLGKRRVDDPLDADEEAFQDEVASVEEAGPVEDIDDAIPDLETSDVEVNDTVEADWETEAPASV